MKIRPMGAEMAEVTKLIVAFRNVSNSPKKMDLKEWNTNFSPE
jgi:hypothetical protein